MRDFPPPDGGGEWRCLSFRCLRNGRFRDMEENRELLTVVDDHAQGGGRLALVEAHKTVE